LRPYVPVRTKRTSK